MSKKIQEAKIDIGSHNRKKSYILQERTVVPALIDLNIMDAQGNVFPSRYDKFRQINRFLEMIEDVIEKEEKKSWNIVDFGCGKSYLTFIVYDYLTRIRKFDVTMIGLDLKADVIEKCNVTAQKYGYERLHFQLGDIKDFQSDRDIDMVISLHACDTATDYALNQAIRWHARIIMAVPCCHKELLHTGDFRDVAMIGAYGLSKERISALLTDNYRGAYLEKMGYTVDMLEMFDLSHSPKNILIRAVKSNRKQSQKSKDVIEQIEGHLKVKLSLGRLLEESDVQT
jgi:SAM-dependent methyltransferase